MFFSIVITVLALGGMVCLHELGHMLAAKSFGVLVHEFSIGMGPKLFSVKRGETAYSLRLLPIGGFVQMEGEISSEGEKALQPRSFKLLKAWKKLVVLAAGALINVLLGLIMLAVINANTYIHLPVVTAPTKGYEEVSAFSAGDELLRIGAQRVHTYEDVSMKISSPKVQAMDSVTVEVRRNGEKVRIDAPLYESGGRKYLMISFAEYVEKPGPLMSLRYAAYDTVYIVKAVIGALGELVTGRQALESLSGPVEIVTVVDQVAQSQSSVPLWISLFSLFALISVNLGVFNLLPIPALDGGQMLFVLVERVTGKEIKPEIVGTVNAIFFALLMLLAVYVTAGDIIGLLK